MLRRTRASAGVALALAGLALALAGLALAAGAARAQVYAVGDRVEPFTLEDQHGEAHTLDADVALLLFSRDMDGGGLIRDALENADGDFLAAIGAAYVADISGMPGLVTRFIALPRMRQRPYPMWLDREGSVTARLPDEEGRATLIALEDLRVTAVEHFETAEALAAALARRAPEGD